MSDRCLANCPFSMTGRCVNPEILHFLFHIFTFGLAIQYNHLRYGTSSLKIRDHASCSIQTTSHCARINCTHVQCHGYSVC